MKNNSIRVRWKSRRTFGDLIVILLLAVLVFIVASTFGIHERLDTWIRTYGEYLQIDELLIVFTVLAGAFGLFSLRRWRELRTEITERERAEEEILRLNTGLERRVIERTSELEATVKDLEKEITERKRVEQELRLSSEILTNVTEGVYLIRTSDGMIVYANPGFEKMFGYDPGEMIGKHVSIVNAPTDKRPEEIAKEIMEALDKTGVWNGEICNVKKDGTTFWCYASVSTFEHEGYGTVWLSVHQDITERKRAEQAIRRLNEDLEGRAIELQAANKELEAFSYSVSHDLRAPLRAVDGFSRILEEEYAPQLPQDVQRYLHMVRTNTQQMGHLVDDLLLFSRLSRQPLVKQHVEPVAIVRQCLEELGKEQEGRRVEITIDDLPGCQADPVLLKQVFFNLLDNAIKFTRRREEAHITIGSQNMKTKPVYYVRDNGVGFDMRYVEKLFGVFQRLHRAEDYEGTGVGLAIVQRIIHRHGGRIWAEAMVDKGAEFYFTLEGGIVDD